MKYKILIFIGLCFFYCNTYAQIGAIWDASATSGTLDGISFTVTGFGNPALNNADLSSSDYSAAPLNSNQQLISYANESNWTITFDSPIKNLRLYISSWRRGSGVNSSGTLSTNGTKLSGSKFTLTCTEVDVSTSYANGIVEFAEDITLSPIP